MSLAPGDLCVVIHTEYDSAADLGMDVFGRTVVLIGEDMNWPPWQAHMAPFWHCSGLPASIRGVSHVSLRKIPPAPLEIEPIDEETEV